MVTKKQYIEGHFILSGVTAGVPVGIPIGLWIGNIAIGPIIGLVLGLIVGAILEKRLNPNPIRLSEFEKARQRKWTWVGLVTGVVVLTIIAIIYFMQK